MGPRSRDWEWRQKKNRTLWWHKGHLCTETYGNPQGAGLMEQTRASQKQFTCEGRAMQWEQPASPGLSRGLPGWVIAWRND
jgi:hypothetical protein